MKWVEIVCIWFVLMLCMKANSKWMQFEDVGYLNHRYLDLSGGVDTSEFQYTAPNNTAVIESSAQRWQNSDYYYLSNLFDKSLYYRTHGTDHAHSYWLGSCSSTQIETVTIKFNKAQDISHIAVAARTMSTNRYSWYAIDAYTLATDFYKDDVSKAVHITQMINTDDDYFGEIHFHSVKGTYELLLFYITKPTTYCALNEIKIFVADPTQSPTLCPTNNPTSEPSSNPSVPPTKNPTITPTFNPTDIPTTFPSYDPTITPTMNPTTIPTLSPSYKPTNNPTNTPTNNPTALPTIKPTNNPSHSPILQPTTPTPTSNPINHPTNNPTNTPTNNPTALPTIKPTNNPSHSPTLQPTTPTPTSNPINHPTTYPTEIPTNGPTANPINIPTINPSLQPTNSPTSNPTYNPVFSPTKMPTVNPSDNSTNVPFMIPTQYPSLNPSSTKITSVTATQNSTQVPKNNFTLISTDFDTTVTEDKTFLHWVYGEHFIFIILGVIGILFVIICFLMIIVCVLIKRFSKKRNNNDQDNVQLTMVKKKRLRVGTASHMEGFTYNKTTTQCQPTSQMDTDSEQRGLEMEESDDMEVFNL